MQVFQICEFSKFSKFVNCQVNLPVGIHLCSKRDNEDISDEYN